MPKYAVEFDVTRRYEFSFSAADDQAAKELWVHYLESMSDPEIISLSVRLPLSDGGMDGEMENISDPMRLT